MWKPLNDKETICAVSSPSGVGGLSVIRISGSKSLNYLRELSFLFPEKPESHKAYLTRLKYLDKKDVIDEVLAIYFAKGRSYTGEETIEISCHGNPFICSEIIRVFLSLGCRIAEPGEFTYRAFINAKIDLVQAESVLSLINSQSKNAAKSSLKQLKGELSERLYEIENILTHVLAHIEAGIDFTHEDIEIDEEKKLIKEIEAASKKIQTLVETYKQGRVIQEGLSVALLGEPNVGKSSLLNSLLGAERAIVTDTAGTTRDTIEGSIIVDNQLINFIDSAGVRESKNKVEKLGVQRALEAARASDRVLFIIDMTLESTDFRILNEIEKEKVIIVLNKQDMDKNNIKYKRWRKIILEKGFSDDDHCKTDTLSQRGTEPLLRLLKEKKINQQDLDNSIVITQARHFDLLTKALDSSKRALAGVKENIGLEFIALDLYESLNFVKEVLGKKFDDDVMDRVFKEFCIGK